MNRQKLATVVTALASVAIGTVTWTLYAPTDAIAPEVYADGGVSGPTHAAKCGVRLGAGCRAGGGQYATLAFPVYVDVQSATKRNILLSPNTPLNLSEGRPCVDFMDFERCDIYPCATNAQTRAVCGRWDAGRPWVRVPAGESECVRRKSDAGPGTCNRAGVLPDGGAGDFGASNVFRRAEQTGDASGCEAAPACVVYAGEDIDG